MIYGLKGMLISRGENFLAIGVGGVVYKAFVHKRTMTALPEAGGEVSLFTHLHVKEDALDLYGFKTKEEMDFFELLISVSGVGPKSALSILDVAELGQLIAAIQENRPDLLTQASGIGRKTAERIILELRSKVYSGGAEATVKQMEGDADLLETLVSLGYKRDQAKSVLEKVGPEAGGLQERLKAALKLLANK